VLTRFAMKRDTTTRLGRSFSLSAALIVFAIVGVCAAHAGAQQQQDQKLPPMNQGPPPPPSPNVPGKQGQGLKIDVDLVALHAAVLDKRGVFVDGLPPDSFKVYEDKVLQKLSVAKQEDVPVSMGLVIDNSGSMFSKRAKVNAAALTFVKTSNPEDEAFVVNFNDDYYLDTEHDFTSSIPEMKEALERIDARGSTALYDAIIGSLDHLKKAHRDKRVLLVVTDGMDNASRHTLTETINEVQHSDAVIYTVGLFGKEDKGATERKARKALQDLADATGGLAYFPEAVEDTESICTEIAHDIRNQYTLAYYPTHFERDGTFRTVQVAVTNPHGGGKLTVRTRTGYYAKSSTKAATK
jgi:Ca-activated chloride channel family protein